MGPASAATPLVRIDGISKTYREAGAETPVLEDASLELAHGEIASLIGPSGSGKSTLVALIAGLLLPESGSIAFGGRELTALDDASRARLRATRIGIVLQSGNLLPFLTAVENVQLALELGGARRARRRAHQLLADVGLGDRAHHLPHRLSGGEAQRVAVAVALANEPDLLLADEATGELDSATADQVISAILEVGRRRSLTVLFVTHSTTLAERATRRLCLSGGQVREAP